LLDHNSTPPAELVGEIIPTGGEEGDDVPQNGRGQILAEVEGISCAFTSSSAFCPEGKIVSCIVQIKL
jgi:hypothetical protein